MVALVGESGSGKSMTALAVLSLLPAGGVVVDGQIQLADCGDLLALPERERRSIRGRRIAMVFQDPSSALNPVFSIGFQIAEVLKTHLKLPQRAAWRRAAELLDRVAMPDPGGRLHSYPHELSGGQRQRAMLALALAGEPELLIADEPTTALDVTLQAQILDLLKDLQQELGLSILLITHDLGTVAACCDRILVMYAGTVGRRGAARGAIPEPCPSLQPCPDRGGAAAGRADLAGRDSRRGSRPPGNAPGVRFCPAVLPGPIGMPGSASLATTQRAASRALRSPAGCGFGRCSGRRFRRHYMTDLLSARNLSCAFRIRGRWKERLLWALRSLDFSIRPKGMRCSGRRVRKRKDNPRALPDPRLGARHRGDLGRWIEPPGSQGR